MTSRVARLVLVGILLTTGLAVGAAATRAGASTPQQTTIPLRGASYTPKAASGGTDDYHCTLVNPHVTKDSYIVSAHFFPNSIEVHHAILFLIPPSLAATAKADDKGGKGWTCFGESALPNSTPTQSGGAAPVTKTAAVTGGPGGSHFQHQISNTPWLTAWAPGHGASYMPKGTGVELPAGSLVVMQIHYNLLRGDKPVRAKLVLHTVPASTRLQALHLDLLVAPPDVPCAAGVTGALCSRSAELANIGQRFGPQAIFFDNIIEQACGRNPSAPPVGTSTTCVWPIGAGQSLLQVTAHMHLTGRAMQVVLDPGTPNAQTLLDVTNYNFDYQKTYTLVHPVETKPGDTIGVTCTYDPSLAQELPQLRKLPPHFTVWGDGSSDEMCLAILGGVHGTYSG
jgi:hypothetical protein